MYQKDRVFIWLQIRFTLMGMTGMPDFDKYSEQYPSVVTFEP
jgi:uncharacterized short protein YbdD (DUF466 family)